jgi:hypothetical protein
VEKLFFAERKQGNKEDRIKREDREGAEEEKVQEEGVPLGGTVTGLLCRVYIVLPFFTFLRGSWNPNSRIAAFSQFF